MSKVIVLIGKKKTGKTTLVKKIISLFNLNKEIFDPNQHYTGFGNQWPSDKIEPFLKRVYSMYNTVIVIEEATINFKSAKRQDELQSLCVRSRHQNNTVLLCFHSLRSLPTWIFDVTDALYLFKTMDTASSLDKFDGVDRIEEAFEEVMSSPDLHHRYFIDFYNESG